MAFVGHRFEDGCDQFRIGGQGQIFLGAGADRIDGAARIGADTAGHDRRADAFGRQRAHEAPDVERHIRHHQVGAAPVAQFRHRLIDIGRVRDFRTAIHGDFGRRSDLALEPTDDE